MFCKENGSPNIWMRTSGSMVGNFITSWTIENFSRYDDSIGNPIYSSPISTNNNISWQICIYPGGIVNNRNGKYVSCVLNFQNSPKGYLVRFAVSLKNSSEETVQTFRCSEWTDPNKQEAFRIETFVPREALLKRMSDNKLLVVVELSYSTLSVERWDRSERCDRYDSPGVSPMAATLDDLASLHKTGRYGDVNFRVGSKKFVAHKAVLAARSRVFAAMFAHDTIESKSRVVEISDFDEGSVESLLRFIYSGNVDSINCALALELLRAAEKYDLQDLKTCCSIFLIAELNNHNVLEVLVAADVFNAATLRHKCIEYFCQHKSSIDLQNNRAILQQYPNILVDIISKFPDIQRRGPGSVSLCTVCDVTAEG